MIKSFYVYIFLLIIKIENLTIDATHEIHEVVYNPM